MAVAKFSDCGMMSCGLLLYSGIEFFFFVFGWGKGSVDRRDKPVNIFFLGRRRGRRGRAHCRKICDLSHAHCSIYSCLVNLPLAELINPLPLLECLIEAEGRWSWKFSKISSLGLKNEKRKDHVRHCTLVVRQRGRGNIPKRKKEMAPIAYYHLHIVGTYDAL